MKRRHIPSLRAPAAANNPIAKAVAKAKAERRFQTTMLDFMLAINAIRDDEYAYLYVIASVQIISVCLIAMAKNGYQWHWSTQVLQDALATLDRCAQRRHAWRVSDTPAVDAGVQAVVDILPQLPEADVTDSWAEYRRAEGLEVEKRAA